MADTYIPVKDLSSLEEIDNMSSFIMVDKESNKGLLLDYNKLIEDIINRFISDEMPTDGLKFYIVE